MAFDHVQMHSQPCGQQQQQQQLQFSKHAMNFKSHQTVVNTMIVCSVRLFGTHTHTENIADAKYLLPVSKRSRCSIEFNFKKFVVHNIYDMCNALGVCCVRMLGRLQVFGTILCWIFT